MSSPTVPVDMRSLRTRITLTTVKFLLALGVVLFASAGTIRYWEAWVYLALQLAGMAATNVYLFKKDPALLERRLAHEQGEKEKVQKVVMTLFWLFGLAMLVFAGVDHRLGWSAVPPALVAASGVVFAAGTLVVFLVFRENTYASSIIEVNAGQKVVSTGPYRLVRHPMYSGTLIMGLATPLLLGSYVAALALGPGWVLLAIRIVAEERFLSEQLPGYKEYMTTTRYRLIPGVW